MAESAYKEFLQSKRLRVLACGRDVAEADVNSHLFPFQRAIVRWAVRKGRCAIFADTGLGKTPMQLEWARLIGGRCLLIAPLQVAQQTVREASKFEVDSPIAIDREGKAHNGITVTNYEQAPKFRAADFDSVVIDESSILKAVDGKTRGRLIKQFGRTRYRLCCTATPAPNDITEIANHAEFLGVMTRAEMLAAFFVHDTSHSARAGWRLKRHAVEPFYQWLASWAMFVRLPSDLGFDDDGYILPELTVDRHEVKTGYVPPGEMFFTGLHGIQDRTRTRKATVEQRVELAAGLVNGGDSAAIVWCGLNEESRRVAAAIPGAVEITGSEPVETKVEKIEAFVRGETRVIVTKGKIAGFGMNFQHCAHQVFLGLNDSWEGYYQAIRRSWRFGQERPVKVDIVMSDVEEEVYLNVMRKEKEAREMADRLAAEMSTYERAEIEGAAEADEYAPEERKGDRWRMMLGDSSERLGDLEDDSVDLAVFSPPFGSLFTYSPTPRDLGNSRTDEEFLTHFGFVIRELLRVVRPGRLVCCHCQQLPMRKMHDGAIGLKDFRGDLIRAFSHESWVYHGEICIDKCPQAQAIRTKAKGLLFVTKAKDSSWLRQAFADYILLFRKPGENQVPVKTDVTNDEWIQWARPVWYGIKETETLQVAEGRDGKDEKHVCPLQLETIERCVRLWSNPGELVLSPFAGIGSEGYVALRQRRRFVGIELKASYFKAAVVNLMRAESSKEQLELFE